MKKFTKKFLSSLLAISVTFSGLQVQAAGQTISEVTPIPLGNNGYVTMADLTEKNSAAPEAWGALPDANQYKYHKDELSAFCHFGMNTFTGSEWGNGNESPSSVSFDEFDEDTFVRTLKEAGFKQLIITAKHHDGFCIWQSEYTTHDMEGANYKNGQGDILEELSAACTTYDMDMGLYLSPWDVNAPSYGYYDENGEATSVENDAEDYNEYYNNQLIEILGNDKYGNNGRFVEVWMDGAKGTGASAQEYDFTKWFTTIQQYEGVAAGREADCMLFGANAYTTVRWIGNENGFADDETWSKSTVNYEDNTINSNRIGSYTKGIYNGNKWTVPECDARITSGWFWGNSKKSPKSISALADMYFRSVGHGGVLLLNVPPNNTGTVDQAILDRVKEFGENVKDTFRVNYASAATATVSASAVRNNDSAFGPANVVDGDDNTYWTLDDGQTTGSLIVDLGARRVIDVVSIEEAIQLGQRISSFTVEYRDGESDTWKTFGEGATIGSKRLCRGPAVKATQIRINITGSYAVPVISEVGVYKASAGFSVGAAAPDAVKVIEESDAAFSAAGWTKESGSQFHGNGSMWTNTGRLTLTFTGSKLWLYGTVDPNHGKANISIDDGPVKEIDTKATTRAVQQLIYESDDLEYGEHTLTLVGTSAAIGIDFAYVLDNNGKGMFELSQSAYITEEDTQLEITVKRIGGSSGSATVILEDNPGSAVQSEYNPTNGIRLNFNDGETEKKAYITINRQPDPEKSGDLEFTVEISALNSDTSIGFVSLAVVTIKDKDESSPERLGKWLEEAATYVQDDYQNVVVNVNRWTEFQNKIAAAQTIYEKSDATTTEIRTAITELTAAMDALIPIYTEANPFNFPSRIGDSKLVEAENFRLIKHAPGETDNSTNKNVRVNSNANVSGTYSVGWLEYMADPNNEIQLQYYAPKTGTYKVTATYLSGRPSNNPNSIAWSEAGGKITSGSVDVYNKTASTTDYETVDFNIEVTEAGAGLLKITPEQGKSGPNLDCFLIEATEVVMENYNVQLVANAGGKIMYNGAEAQNTNPELVEGSEVELQFTPNEGYRIADVLVNEESMGDITSYRIDDLSKNMKIEVKFSLIATAVETNYTITFNPNEGTLTNSAEGTRIVTQNQALGNLPAVTRPGFTLAGWYTQQTGGTVVDSNTVPTSDTTYYARWTEEVVDPVEPGTTYTQITSGLTGTASSSQSGKGVELALDGQINTHWHTQWSDNYKADLTNNVGNDYIIDLGMNYEIGKFGYVPRSDGEDSDANSGVQNGRILTYELYYSTEATGDNFTKINITNNTWANDKTEKEVTFDGVTARRIKILAKSSAGNTDANTNVYVHAAEFKVYQVAGTTPTPGPVSYTVTFNVNGGTGANTTRSVQSGQPVGAFPDVTRTGYTLSGWYTAASGGDKVETTTTVTGNVTYYAQWQVQQVTPGPGPAPVVPVIPVTPTVTTFTVTFDGNGGTASKASAEINSGEAVGTLPTATRAGYTFLGWFTAATGGTEVTAATTVTAAMTVYAQWTEVTGGDGSQIEITGQKTAGKSAIITWNKVKKATEYQIYMKTGKGDYELVKTVAGSKTKFTIAGLKTGKNYKFRVTANTGKNAKKKVTYGKSVTMTWKNVSGYASYDIQMKVGKGDFESVKIVTKGGTVSYTVKSAKVGKKYTFRILGIM